MDPNSSVLSSPSRACSHPAESCVGGGRSPPPREQGRDSSFPWSQVPSSSLTDPDWFWDEHVQAKRARVETIIRGMCLSPNPLMPGNTRARDSPCCPEKARERKRKQSLPMQQNPLKPGPAGNHGSRKGAPRMKEQLHLLKQQLRHLQEHILQAAEPRDTAQSTGSPEKGWDPHNVKQKNGYESRPWVVDSDHHQGSGGDLSGVDKHCRVVSEVEYQPEEPVFLPSGTRALLEILRKELTGAVSQAVDSILQKVLLDPQGHLTQRGRNFQRLVPEGRIETSPEGSAYKDPLSLAALPRRAQAQAQAGVSLGNLSLAKPPDSSRYPTPPRMIPKSYQGPPANCPLAVPSHIQENQILGQLLDQGPRGLRSGNLPRDSPSQSRSSAESALQPWGAVKLLPPVLSQQQVPSPFASTCLERLSLLPSVKMEHRGLQAAADVLPFSSVHISFTSN